MKALSVILAVVVASVLLAGCTTQGGTGSANNSGGVGLAVEKGDTVAVDYLGTLDNGTVFDTSIKAEAEEAGLPLRPSYSPLDFVVGAGQMIKGFDDAVVGMSEGEEKNVHLAPADAYGEKRADLVVVFPVSQIPGNVSVSTVLTTTNGMQGKVVQVNADNVTIDFNSELAGQALNFKIIVKKITKG